MYPIAVEFLWLENDGLMGKLLNFIDRFMYGRYGLDPLGIVIITVSLLFAIIGRAFFLFYILALALIGYEIYRILSRNIAAREKENSIITNMFNRTERSRDDYVHFSCPNCGQHLRIPAGLGQKRITCPKCNARFVKRT